jgi:hypothetical protein
MGILLLSTSQVTGQQDEPNGPQGTYGSAFTYQGQLKGTGGPVNGVCDLRFRLFAAAGGGTPVGSTITHEGVELADGLFTARLDFGRVHDGNARWLEIAVRCPAGSGGYVTLSPRQELTAAPAALSLVLPFLADANLGGPLLWIENNGVGEAAGFESVGGIALWVEAPASEGVHVATAGQDGVHVVNAGGHGFAVDAASSNGVFVNSAVGSGLAVDSAGSSGVHVASAGADGVKVSMAGSPSMAVYDYKANGFEIGGAQGDGLFVGRADVNGIRVGSAGNDGVYVGIVGNPSNVILDPARTGFTVGGAEGHGLFVGRADGTGVYVQSAGWNGLVVEEAGGDGVRATNTVYNALYGDTANAQGEWGLYTPDKAHAQNVTLHTLTLVAQVTGPDALSPGDIVAAAGVAPPSSGNSTPLPLVRLATADWNGVAGVVEGRLAPTPAPQPEGEGTGGRLELRSAEGPARPGDYVALTVLGVARVKVDAGQGNIQPGTRLTSSTGGRARTLKTVIVEGVTLTESAPTIGIALATPDENGLVWVLVNPQ